VGSARPDGATSVALALAAQLSTGARTLLVDLNTAQPELGALLDLDGQRNVSHLAHAFLLGPIRTDELEATVVFSDGLACVAGITHPDQAFWINEAFVGALVEAASGMFDQVVLDVGRVRPGLPGAEQMDRLLWIIQPSPLGLAAFDRAWRVLDADAVGWVNRLAPVLNRADERSIDSIGAYLRMQAGLIPVATIPECRGLWRKLEYSHSLDPLLAPLHDEKWYGRAHGPEALAYRRALATLLEAIPAEPEAQPVER
jgi:MinD-like ATPase involved in chromosome partitioning or flagellar assembly